MNVTREPPDLIDPTMMKRQRVVIIGRPDTDTQSSSSYSQPKTKIQINVTPAGPTPEQERQQRAREKTRANIIEIRFKKAIRINDSTTLIKCLESGFKPTTLQWLKIVGKMHVATALNCVKLARTLEAPCILGAIRRQHRGLFKEVLARVNEVPRTQMENLMTVPAFYLGVCLDKGLDPNVRLKNNRLPLEHACSHSRIAHIEILLKDERTTVSQNVCRFVIRQAKQQKFADRAIELCEDIVPNMILEAVVANVTGALRSIMKKLEPKYESNSEWDDITHMMQCPILSDYTTDIVKTPINDHYYDRQSLLKWVREKGTDPMTREDLRESDLLLRSEFLKEYATELQAKIKKLG
tara:strand:+ start:2611 stop:3669 length:1059 start_codon:yes stop_codon:yes gene_type:complete